MANLNNWMSELEPSRKLVELWLPGSHDAGVYTDKEKDVEPGDSARCQDGHIGEQASVGSRVFDIRVFLRSTGILGRTKIPTMGHFFRDTAPLGDWGGTLESALNDAAVFLTAYKKEFLIFRIGHTECLAEVAEVLEKFRNADTSENFNFRLPPRAKKIDPTGKTNASLFHRGAKSLADVVIEQLRGKLVVLCDDKNLQSKNFEPSNGYYLYDKYLPTSPSTAQIRFCGKYGGSPVKTSTKGKGNWSAEGSVKNAEDAFLEHQNHKLPDHLWWVYWQETGGNVSKNTAATTGMHNRLENFLHTFKANTNLPHPNVIGQDFVEKVTCGAIVKMNPDLAAKLDAYGY